MNVWLLQILDELGFSTKNLTDHHDADRRFLDPGENSILQLPDEFKSEGALKVKKWKVKEGQKVYPGSVICILKSPTREIEFVSFLGGRLKQAHPRGKLISDGNSIAELVAHV